MNALNIFYPVFAQVMLTFLVMTLMGVKRVSAVKKGEVKIRDIALGEPNWPTDITQVANNYHNQFQLPVLFYTACVFAYVSGSVSGILLALAWGFVATRLVHSYVHVTSNHVPKRANVFFIGCGVLFAMWLVLFVQILSGAR